MDLFVGGADKGSFDLSDDGALTFMDHMPNYEGQKEYSITLMVEDDEFALGTHDVTVKVRNDEDDGTVTLNAREPQIGKAVLASLDDKDGTVRGQTWTWGWVLEDSGNAACPDNGYTLIADATSPSYVPKEDVDENFCLQATVTYADKFVRDDEATTADTASMQTERAVQAADPANTAPAFPNDNDPNMPGDQEVAEREVAENAKTEVGNVVRADDADLLMYSISDTDNFKVDNFGQISTIANLDYESLPEDAKYHMVTVSAVDPSGASDSTMVKITVTDADDKPVITGDKTFEYFEGTVSVGTFSATDEDGNDIVWDKSGEDAGQFKVTASEDGASAELTFDPAPNFESPADKQEGQRLQGKCDGVGHGRGELRRGDNHQGR